MFQKHCKVRGGMVSVGVTCGCCGGLVGLFVQSSCVILIIVMEL
jgi:hypothetical protein